MTEGHAVTDSRDDLPFMVHSDLDDLDLSPFEFRAYVHLVRRAGTRGGEYWESVDAGATHCRMDAKTYRAALKALVDRGLLTREDRPGETSVYRLAPRRQWRTPTTSGTPTRNGRATTSGRGTPTKSGRTPLPETVDKENPLKGIPGRESQELSARARFDPAKVDLPDFIDPQAWADFVTHRREIKKRLTTRAVDLILADLAKTPEDANGMLRQTIARGWTGVFPLDKRKNGTPEERAADTATGLLAHLRSRHAH